MKSLFRALYGDGEGGVWLGESDLSTDASSRFFLTGSAGEWARYLDFPREVRILDITEDRVLAIETNEVGVRALALYRLKGCYE
jgi:hypothetical protein